MVASSFSKSWRLPVVLSLCLVTVVLLPGSAVSQVSLGGQRVGTASGAFLKLPLTARGTSLGGAFIAVADDVSSVAWNPAGLASISEKGAVVSYVQWFADIDYTFAAYGQPWPWFSGSVGVFFGSLGTELNETTEYMPYGTGQKFTFNDWVAGLSLARRLTDKLLLGANVKYVREELGTEVGGPVTNSWLLDVGTKYYVGLSTVRMAMLLTNFGPELRPSGSFSGLVDGTSVTQSYEGFTPPTTFKFGVAFDPVDTEPHKLTATLEMDHYADNEETIKAGLEYTLRGVAALRGGYDFNSDSMGLSLGAGVRAGFAGVEGSIDYSYSRVEYLGDVNIFTVNVSF
jgi:hypothetical protein